MTWNEFIETKSAHEYSTTQVDLPPEMAEKLTIYAAGIPKQHLAGDDIPGRPHITLKHGLHGDDSDEVAAALADQKPTTATLGNLSIFKNQDAHAGRVHPACDGGVLEARFGYF